ncbi:MAG: hypothetical protein WAV54_13345 [Acidimicrobiales bacterium]
MTVNGADRDKFERCYPASRNALIGAALAFPVPTGAALDLRHVEEDQPRRNHREAFTA